MSQYRFPVTRLRPAYSPIVKAATRKDSSTEFTIHPTGKPGAWLVRMERGDFTITGIPNRAQAYTEAARRAYA